MLIQKKISTRIYLSEFSCRCRCCCCFYCCSALVLGCVLLLSCPSNGKQNARRKQKREASAHTNKLQNAKEMSIHELHFKILVLFSAAVDVFSCYSIGKMKTKRKHRCMWKWNVNHELNSIWQCVCERFDAAMRRRFFLGCCFNWPKWINVCKFNLILIKGH